MGKLFIITKSASGHDVGTLVYAHPAGTAFYSNTKYLGNWCNAALSFWDSQAKMKRVPCTKANLRKHQRSIRKCWNYKHPI